MSKQVFQDYALPHLKRPASQRASARDDALAKAKMQPQP